MNYNYNISFTLLLCLNLFAHHLDKSLLHHPLPLHYFLHLYHILIIPLFIFYCLYFINNIIISSYSHLFVSLSESLPPSMYISLSLFYLLYLHLLFSLYFYFLLTIPLTTILHWSLSHISFTVIFIFSQLFIKISILPGNVIIAWLIVSKNLSIFNPWHDFSTCVGKRSLAKKITKKYLLRTDWLTHTNKHTSTPLSLLDSSI